MRREFYAAHRFRFLLEKDYVKSLGMMQVDMGLRGVLENVGLESCLLGAHISLNKMVLPWDINTHLPAKNPPQWSNTRCELLENTHTHINARRGNPKGQLLGIKSKTQRSAWWICLMAHFPRASFGRVAPLPSTSTLQM